MFVYSLANRLVGGLASENVRWAESVESFKTAATTLPGDVLLVTAFVSYVGCFIKTYRTDLVENQWRPYLKSVKVNDKRPIHIIEIKTVYTEVTFSISGANSINRRIRSIVYVD